MHHLLLLHLASLALLSPLLPPPQVLSENPREEGVIHGYPNAIKRTGRKAKGADPIKKKSGKEQEGILIGRRDSYVYH